MIEPTAENRRKRNAVAANKYYRAHKDQIAARKREYYLDHKGEWVNYYSANKERIARQKRECHKRNPNSRRNMVLRQKFGITVKEYEALISKQNGVCAICESEEKVIHHRTKKPKRLAVDHDHVTKRVRGLLCSKCNRAVGLLEDNVGRLQRVIQYLERSLQ